MLHKYPSSINGFEIGIRVFFEAGEVLSVAQSINYDAAAPA